MSNIQISLDSLIKSNNGYFKSDKQAKFLLSMLKENNVFSGVAHGHVILIQYSYDDEGITLKTKTSQTTNKTEQIWGRKVEGVLSVEEQQIINNLNKQLKKVKKAHDKALKSFADGSYFGDKIPQDWELEIFNNCRNDEAELILRIEKSIASYM